MFNYYNRHTYGDVLFAPDKRRVGSVGITLAALATLIGCGGNPSSPTPTPTPTPSPAESPTISNIKVNGNAVQPSVTLMLPADTSTADLEFITNMNARCRYAESPNVEYAAMPNQISSADGRNQSSKETNRQNGTTYPHFIRCEAETGAVNTTDVQATYAIAKLLSGKITLDGQFGVPVNGNIEFLDYRIEGRDVIYTSLSKGTINNGDYKVSVNDTSKIKRVRITGTNILNMERNYTDKWDTAFERRFFDGQDPIPFWDEVNRTPIVSAINRWPLGNKRADKPLTFYIDTRTNIGDNGVNQTKAQRIQVFKDSIRYVFEQPPAIKYTLIESDNPPAAGNGNVIVKFGICCVSSTPLFSGYVVDGGELKLFGIDLDGKGDNEETAGLTSHFGFDNRLKPSIGNEPSSGRFEDVDKYLKRFSFWEPLGSTSKTLDGIVIESFAPVSSAQSFGISSSRRF